MIVAVMIAARLVGGVVANLETVTKNRRPPVNIRAPNEPTRSLRDDQYEPPVALAVSRPGAYKTRKDN